MEKVICNTITQDKKSLDEFLDLFSKYEKADVESLDISGNSVKKYVLVKSSYKYSGNLQDWDRFTHTLELLEKEEFNVEKLIIDDQEFVPYHNMMVIRTMN